MGSQIANFSKVGTYLKKDAKLTGQHLVSGQLPGQIGQAGLSVGKTIGSVASAPLNVVGGAAGEIAATTGRTLGSIPGRFINNLKEGFKRELNKGLRKPGEDSEFDFSEYARARNFDSIEDKLENLERRKKNLEENNGDSATLRKVDAKIQRLESKKNSEVISGADESGESNDSFSSTDAFVKLSGGKGKVVAAVIRDKLRRAGKTNVVRGLTEAVKTGRIIPAALQAANAYTMAKGAKDAAESGDLQGTSENIQGAIASGAQALNMIKPTRKPWYKRIFRRGFSCFENYGGISEQLPMDLRMKSKNGLEKKFKNLKLNENNEGENMNKKAIKQFANFCDKYEVEFSENNFRTFSDMKFCFHKFCKDTGMPFTSKNFAAFCDSGVCPVCREEQEVGEIPAPPSQTSSFADTGSTELPDEKQGILPEDKAAANEDNKVDVDDGLEEMDHDALKAFSEFCDATGLEYNAKNFMKFAEATSELPDENPKEDDAINKEDKKAAEEDAKPTVEDGEKEVKDHEELKQAFCQFCEETGIGNTEENFKLFAETEVESKLPDEKQGILPEDKKEAAEDNAMKVEEGASEVTDHEALKAFSEFCDASGVEYSEENFKLFCQK